MILIKNINKLVGTLEKPYSFKKGKALSLIGTIENAFLLIKDGKISSYGTNGKMS